MAWFDVCNIRFKIMLPRDVDIKSVSCALNLWLVSIFNYNVNQMYFSSRDFVMILLCPLKLDDIMNQVWSS